MALPNGAGGYQVGDGNLTEAVLGVQTIPTTLTGDTTLTAAQVAAMPDPTMAAFGSAISQAGGFAGGAYTQRGMMQQMPQHSPMGQQQIPQNMPQQMGQPQQMPQMMQQSQPQMMQQQLAADT